MKIWGYGISSYNKTAHIFLDEGPFYLFILGWIIDTLDEILSFLEIPLPKIMMKLRDPDEIEDNDGKEWTTWYAQYGYWCCLYSIFIWGPVWDWICERMCNKVVEMPYDKARELFYESNEKFWDEEEGFAEEMKKEEED